MWTYEWYNSHQTQHFHMRHVELASLQNRLSSHGGHSFLFLIIHVCVRNTYKRKKMEIRAAFTHTNTKSLFAVVIVLTCWFHAEFLLHLLFPVKRRMWGEIMTNRARFWRWVQWIYRSVVKAEWNQSVNQTLPVPVLIQFAPRNSSKKVSNCNFLSPTVTWMLLLNYINLWPGMKMKLFLNRSHPCCWKYTNSHGVTPSCPVWTCEGSAIISHTHIRLYTTESTETHLDFRLQTHTTVVTMTMTATETRTAITIIHLVSVTSNYSY